MVNLAPLLDPADYDCDQFRQILIRRMDQCGPGTSHATAFHKCACLYDLLHDGPALSSA
ncbi:hypothetical protein [Streptomyces thermolilacinus]|uniref:hypothetical protein n=1 Tax=Streptomyces thermolilacinus TaxID=285540 RepID=UPI0033DD67A5